MNKHASGPWYVSKNAGHEVHGQFSVAQEGTGGTVAMVYNGKANAQLIAAAPELLEALENVLPALDRAFAYDGDVFGILHNDAVDAYSKARATIDKARADV